MKNQKIKIKKKTKKYKRNGFYRNEINNKTFFYFDPVF